MSRALVLGGGGLVGNAWEIGLLAGLLGAGVALGDADLIVGTSAGSAVGAQLALGRDFDEQLKRFSRPEAAAEADAVTGGGDVDASEMPAGFLELMDWMAEAAGTEEPDDVLARIGAFALAAETFAEDVFVGFFADMADETWPTHYVCTAVDALTGAFQAWDATAGAPLDRGVASSCSVPGVFPPVTINGRRFVDGGMRSFTNADVAVGHDRVLIVSVLSVEPGDGADGFLASMAREQAAIAAAGGTVEVLGPDAASAAVLGLDASGRSFGNLMDGSRAAGAAAAGLLQGQRAADQMRSFWN
jgi:NTE family protein